MLLVKSVTVGRFYYNNVGLADLLRIVYNGAVNISNVAAENQLFGFSVFGYPYFNAGRA